MYSRVQLFWTSLTKWSLPDRKWMQNGILIHTECIKCVFRFFVPFRLNLTSKLANSSNSINPKKCFVKFNMDIIWIWIWIWIFKIVYFYVKTYFHIFFPAFSPDLKLPLNLATFIYLFWNCVNNCFLFLKAYLYKYVLKLDFACISMSRFFISQKSQNYCFLMYIYRTYVEIN